MTSVENANSSTKNTKDNRKVVVAYFSFSYPFKIPDGIDLEDETVVQAWNVKYGTLNILYVDGRKEEIEPVYDIESDYKWPDETEIVDAEDYNVEYSEDEEEEEYPTIEEILSKMKELKEDENEWDDDTIYDAICEWDDKFADDPDWFDEEDTDMKDSLRDQVCMHLGLGEFKKEEVENYEVDKETGEKFNMQRFQKEKE